MVTFLDHQVIATLGEKLKNFQESWNATGIDSYIIEVYAADHERHCYTRSDIAYWTERFDTSWRDRFGNKHPKGFLEINY